MRRWILVVEVSLVLGVLALPFLDLLFGRELWLLPVLTTFHFYVLLVPALLGLGVALTRARRRHWPLLLAPFGLAAFYLPASLPSNPEPPVEPPLRLMTWNVQADRGHAELLVEVIEELAPNVLALQEVVAPGLEEKGLVESLVERGWTCEYRGYFEDRPRTGIGLCVRSPITILQASSRTYHPAGEWSYLFSEVRVENRILNLVIPHFLAYRIKQEDPLRSTAKILQRVRRTVSWHRQEASALLELLNRLEDPTFLVGDFNSTPWQATHIALRRRFVDAHSKGGTGLGATFRYFVPLRIDFIYAPPGARVLSAKTGPYASSDHRPILAVVDLANLPEASNELL